MVDFHHLAIAHAEHTKKVSLPGIILAGFFYLVKKLIGYIILFLISLGTNDIPNTHCTIGWIVVGIDAIYTK
jgi:hypothetical protein